MPTASIGDITVGYDEAGDGDQALVLVHGHPFNRSMWQPQLERFGRPGLRVVAADLRGYGATSVVPGTTTFETFARDVIGLADHLNLGSFALGGLSMGGQIVMETYRLFPERITGLILADTSAQAETPASRTARRQLADRLETEGMGPYAEEVLTKMVAPSNIARLPEVADKVMLMMQQTPSAGAAAAMRGRSDRPDYLETLKSATVPALVVVGSEDDFTPIADAELMHNTLPSSTLAIIKGAAHMPNLEREDEFNAALDTFLLSLEQR
ncbi:alpha/beta fold hydrolase [Kribbella sp. NPDC023855]|uniref:alpha/beta fold hydrolase n=1 Tax=Kribbella sp. NPDC023855 TaxID=3154698 RepID=UPI0033ECCCD5